MSRPHPEAVVCALDWLESQAVTSATAHDAHLVADILAQEIARLNKVATREISEWRDRCATIRALGYDAARAHIAEWLDGEGYATLAHRVTNGAGRKS